MLTRKTLLVLVTLWLAACSGEDSSGAPGSGGTAGTGHGRAAGSSGQAGSGGTSSPVDWPSVCAAEPLPATGVYYFCNCGDGATAGCINGNDSTGLGTLHAPWQSWAHVNSTWKTLRPGETIALCKGGAWDNSTADDDDTWKNHGTQTQPVTMRDYVSPVFTSNSKPRLYKGGFNFRHASHLRLLNLALAGPGNNNGWGIYSGDGQSDWTVCNVSLSGFKLAIFVEAENAVSGVKIRGNTFDSITNLGFLGGGPGLIMDGNVFTNCGGAGSMFDHSVNLANADNMKFINNRIVPSNSAGGSPLVAHGMLRNLTVENNVMDRSSGPAGWNWDFSGGGYSQRCGLPGLIFRRNRLYAGENVGTHIVSAPNAIIEDNIFDLSYKPGTGVVLARECDCKGGCETTTNVTVRNNTIYLPKGGAGIQMDVGSDNYVANNAIDGAGITCFTGNFYTMEDYNLCTGKWGRTPGAHDLTSQPGFTGPLTPPQNANFTPKTNSPLVNAGSPDANCMVGGVANQPCSSGLAANSPLWRPADPAKIRSNASDIGALER